MASFEFDKQGMKKFEKELQNRLNNLEFKKGSNPRETERNIIKELKNNGIEPNSKTVKDLAKKAHE